jgi:hypothetical protein
MMQVAHQLPLMMAITSGRLRQRSTSERYGYRIATAAQRWQK